MRAVLIVCAALSSAAACGAAWTVFRLRGTRLSGERRLRLRMLGLLLLCLIPPTLVLRREADQGAGFWVLLGGVSIAAIILLGRGKLEGR